MDAWRSLLQARTHWYPIMQQLHRFMIAVSRVAVNHDGKGGSAPDLLVWDHVGELGMCERLTLGLMLILPLSAWTTQVIGWALDAGSRWFRYWY